MVRNGAVACSERTVFASLRARATFPLCELLHGASTAGDKEPPALLGKTTPCAGARSRAGVDGRAAARARAGLCGGGCLRRGGCGVTLMMGATALALLGPGGQFGLYDVVCAGAAAARLRASRLYGSLAPLLAGADTRGCMCCADRCPERAAHRCTLCMRVTYERSVVFCFGRSASGKRVARLHHQAVSVLAAAHTAKALRAPRDRYSDALSADVSVAERKRAESGCAACSKAARRGGRHKRLLLCAQRGAWRAVRLLSQRLCGFVMRSRRRTCCVARGSAQ